MEFEESADRLAALGNPTRLQIFRLLVKAGFDGMPVGAIQTELGVPASTRDELREALQAKKIGTEIYYPLPLHRQECFNHLGYGPGSLPVSEAAAARTFALPVYPELSPEQLDYVVESIGEQLFGESPTTAAGAAGTA